VDACFCDDVEESQNNKREREREREKKANKKEKKKQMETLLASKATRTDNW